MLKRIYTPALMPPVHLGEVVFPLNPFRVIETQLRQYCSYILNNIHPQRDILGNIFGADFCVGLSLGLPVEHEMIVSAFEPARSDVQNWQLEEISSNLDSLALEDQPHQSALHLEEQHPVLSAVHQFGNPIARMISNEQAPMDTVHLRRSTRSTRYDGFRVPQPSDVKSTTSKVKARVNPSITNATKTTAPHTNIQVKPSSSQEGALPPPTPIATIQSVGINLCGINRKELSPKKLLAS